MEDTLQCLLCEDRHPRNKFLSNIHEHIGYIQHVCMDCDFSCASADEMNTHGAEMRHCVGLYSRSQEYLNRLSRIVLEDTHYAADHGMDALYDCTVSRPLDGGENVREPGPNDSGIHVASRPMGRTAERKRLNGESSTAPTPQKKKRKEPEDARSLAPVQPELEEVEPLPEALEEAPQRTPARTVQAVPVTNAEDPPNPFVITRDTKQLFQRTITRNSDHVACNICDEDENTASVPNDFCSRDQHIRDKHASVDADDGMHRDQLKQCHEECFPGAKALTAMHCSYCGSEIRSAEGRVGHVGTHVKCLRVACPYLNCDFVSYDLYGVENHMSRAHALKGSKKRNSFMAEEMRVWKETRANYQKALAPLVAMCFPAPFPADQEKVRNRKSRAGRGSRSQSNRRRQPKGTTNPDQYGQYPSTSGIGRQSMQQTPRRRVKPGSETSPRAKNSTPHMTPGNVQRVKTEPNNIRFSE